MQISGHEKSTLDNVCTVKRDVAFKDAQSPFLNENDVALGSLSQKENPITLS